MTDVNKDNPRMTAVLWISATSTPTCASSINKAARLWRRVCSAHHPRSPQAPLLLGATAAHSHRGGHPLPWVSRVLKEECGHEVLVANPRKTRLIYSNKRKTDEIDALRTLPAWHVWIRSSCTHSSTEAKTPRLIWPSSARARR